MIERNVVMTPNVAALPVPALRLWAYMIVHPRYSGTPSGLREQLADASMNISKRYLPIAIDWLQRAGMVSVYRKGSHLELTLIQPSRRAA